MSFSKWILNDAFSLTTTLPIAASYDQFDSICTATNAKNACSTKFCHDHECSSCWSSFTRTREFGSQLTWLSGKFHSTISFTHSLCFSRSKLFWLFSIWYWARLWTSRALKAWSRQPSFRAIRSNVWKELWQERKSGRKHPPTQSEDKNCFGKNSSIHRILPTWKFNHVR